MGQKIEEKYMKMRRKLTRGTGGKGQSKVRECACFPFAFSTQFISVPGVLPVSNISNTNKNEVLSFFSPLSFEASNPETSYG